MPFDDMQCNDIRDRLLDVMAPDLVSQDAQAQAHLNTCAACRESVARAQSAWTLLTAVPNEEPDSARMRARFAAMLDARREQSRPAVFAWRPLYQAAVVVIALGVGAIAGRQFSGVREQQQNVAAMRQELRDVREMLTLSLMQQDVASERIKGVSTAARISNPPSDVVAALLDTLLHDPSVNVRLAAVRALEGLNARPAVRRGVVDALRREPEPLVTMALIDFVVNAQDRLAVDVLKQMAADPARDTAVRETAARGASQLTGGRL